MLRTDLIDIDSLDEIIASHKGLYLASYANTLKIPSFNLRCEEEIATTQSDEKKKALEAQIKENESLVVQNQEQMKNILEIYDRLMEFRSSL